MPDPITLTPEFAAMLDAVARDACEFCGGEQTITRKLLGHPDYWSHIEWRRLLRSRVLAEIERHVAAERERAKPVVESLDHARERLADVEMIHEDAYRFLFKGDRPLSAVFRALDAYKEPRT